MSLMASSASYQGLLAPVLKARFIGNESTGAIGVSTPIALGTVVASQGASFDTSLGPNILLDLTNGGRVDINQTGFVAGTISWSAQFWMRTGTAQGARLALFHANAPGTAGQAGYASARIDTRVRGAGFSLDLLASINGTSHATNIQDTTVLALNTWHHVAAVFDTSCRIYVNGNLLITAASITPSFRTGRHLMGAGPANASSYENTRFRGYIQNFEVYEGTSLYTSNFTPPARNT